MHWGAAMLTLDRIEYRQGDFNLGLSLRLQAGDRLALLGASGSGKSTLLNLIAGFAWPDAGEIHWDGADISRKPVPERPISILFQDSNLFPHLTAAENVGLGLRPDLRLSDEEKHFAHDALRRVGLDGLADRKPAQLSGGQQGRAGLARMLVQRKPLVLLDEPFAALDPGLRQEMGGLLADLAHEHALTMILVSHDLRDVGSLVSHVALLESGHLAAFGPMDMVAEDPPAALLPWLK